jgi:AbiV family abortive infection protein
LSIEEAAVGMAGAYRNAASLIDDAVLLSRAGRWARAGALGVLALEELAKAPDIHDTVHRSELSPSDELWTEFWRRFSRHEAKQRRIADYGRSLAVGSPLQREMLGHSTVALTLDTYSHVLPSMQATIATQMDAILNGDRIATP